MHSIRSIAALAAISLALSAGCSQQRANNPSVKNNVKDSLKQAGFDKVSVSEDRDKGVVTLKGEVATQEDKAKAEQVAQQAAGNDIVANEILATQGDKGQAKKVSEDVDRAIEARVKQFIDTEKLNRQHIRYEAKNGVLTLTGDVNSPELRASMEKNFASIDGVTQVVDKLDVKKSRHQTAHKDVSGR
jgi:hyperosmotically inducible periplasmic protein